MPDGQTQSGHRRPAGGGLLAGSASLRLPSVPGSEVEPVVAAGGLELPADILHARVVADGTAHLRLHALAVADGLVADFPAVAAGHARQVHLAAIGRANGLAVDDLEIAVAGDGRLGATLSEHEHAGGECGRSEDVADHFGCSLGELAFGTPT